MKKQDLSPAPDSGEPHDSSRRAFLVQSVAGASGAYLALRWSTVLAAEAYAQQASQSPRLNEFKYLTADDAREIEAMAAQIIPTDGTPGAREAGVIYFIDHALNTFDSDLQGRYKAGLRELQLTTREKFPAAMKFSALTAPQQIQVLTAIEMSDFFNLVRQHTIVGFLADPVHGGNRDQIGWKLIGFEGKFAYQAPYGYYDRGYTPGA